MIREYVGVFGDPYLFHSQLEAQLWTLSLFSISVARSAQAHCLRALSAKCALDRGNWIAAPLGT